MLRHHEMHPDLEENVLEERALMASFLGSTFFQFTFTSGTSPFQYTLGGADALSLNEAGGAFDLGGFGGLGYGSSVFATNYAAGSAYMGFGSNPFGSGLSPLDGVVSAYSMNTALSNLVGDGSTLPGDGSLFNGFDVLVPGGSAALRAGAVGGPVNVPLLGAGDLNGPVGYGSSFSTGGNFASSLLRGPVYGSTIGTIGTLSASASGSGATDEVLPPAGQQDKTLTPQQGRNAPNAPHQGHQGDRLQNGPATRTPGGGVGDGQNPYLAPSRPRQAPLPGRGVAPAPQPESTSPPREQEQDVSPRRLNPLPDGEMRDVVPTAPSPERGQAPQDQDQAEPAATPEQVSLLDAVLGEWPLYLG